MMTVKAARDRVRAMLGDPRGAWVSDAYATPLLDQAYGEVNLTLKRGSGKNFYKVVTIPNVPIGASSLYPWQNATGQPADPAAANNAGGYPPLLAGLYDPIQLWIKPAGADPGQYVKLNRAKLLPHVNPQQNFPGSTTGSSWGYGASMAYAWVGNQLVISPCLQPLDIEVTGAFNPPHLAADGDLLETHEDVWIPVVNACAAIIGQERSNPQILQSYVEKARVMTLELIALIVATGQSEPAVFQRIARDGAGNVSGWGMFTY